MRIDTLPYKTFTKLKEKYPTKQILITGRDTVGMSTIFKDHREFVVHLFAREGVQINRFSHDYKSLDTRDPKLGVVFLINDSVINPGLEAWVLLGHNASYMDHKEKSKI